jgi:hypothetical protein
MTGIRNMNSLLIVFTVLTSLIALSACDSLPDFKHKDHAPTQIIYSPTGDPLNGGPLGKPTCAEAMKRWFGRADTNHDNAVTPDEFLADAKAQFQRMDIDKNGYLVSEELERFRMTYRDYPAEKKSEAAGEHEGGQPSGDRHGKHGSGEGGSNASVIDPVMSADTDLDYKVTLDEFVAYSQKTFRGLDTDHTGKLTLAAVTAGMCASDDKH